MKSFEVRDHLEPKKYTARGKLEHFLTTKINMAFD
jgi:hypothetical protein